MRQIIKGREVASDSWRYPADTQAAGPRVLPLKEFLESVQQGSAADSGVGVWLAPDDDVELLAPQLNRVALIVVHFPKDGEGRGFSQGRVLRQRYRFGGELRAAGPIKRDYLYLLARCGFDAFDLHPDEDLKSALGAFDTFTVAYQPGDDALVHPRHRARLYGADSSNL